MSETNQLVLTAVIAIRAINFSREPSRHKTVNPYRSKVIPAYEILKKAAKTAGALGTSISGSGPSIFSLCKGIDIAKEISSTQKKVLNSMDVSFEVYISKINTKGVSIL